MSRSIQSRRRAPMPRRRRQRRGDPMPLVVGIAGGLLLVWLVARIVPHAPPEPSPRELSMREAQIANAAVPFVAGARRAKPFRFRGSPAAREQAIRCLATAALYEAGRDPDAQRAVMQVVLNRVAAPGYPKTVCGVVYQGAERTTGCQFSFTCDGSETRRPEREGWDEARARARRALTGHVFAPVAGSTHYHADWMLPWWMGSLDKTAQVGTHIFYRPRA